MRSACGVAECCVTPSSPTLETTTSTAVKIVDETGREMVEFRKRVYLTIQSSLSYEEAAHKLIKNELRPKMEVSDASVMRTPCASIES